MHKFYIFIINILKTLDKMAYSLLVFGVIIRFIAFLPFDVFFVDVTDYTDLNTAKETTGTIYNILYVKQFLFIMKNKYQKLEKLEIIFWFIVFLTIPYFIYQIPSIKNIYNIG